MREVGRKVGRPKGVSFERKDIELNEFNKIVEFVLEDERLKEVTRQNILKSIYLLYFFGFRVGELTLLTCSDIKRATNDKVISLGNNTKTKRPREAYIDDVHVGILEEVFQQELTEDDRWSLIRPWGKVMSQYNPSTLQRLLNRVIHEALDSTQYSTHSFRAGYITELHRNGIPVKIISKVIGHFRESTTMLYITVTEQEKKEAVASRVSPPSISSYAS